MVLYWHSLCTLCTRLCNHVLLPDVYRAEVYSIAYTMRCTLFQVIYNVVQFAKWVLYIMLHDSFNVLVCDMVSMPYFMVYCGCNSWKFLPVKYSVGPFVPLETFIYSSHLWKCSALISLLINSLNICMNIYSSDKMKRKISPSSSR